MATAIQNAMRAGEWGGRMEEYWRKRAISTKLTDPAARGRP